MTQNSFRFEKTLQSGQPLWLIDELLMCSHSLLVSVAFDEKKNAGHGQLVTI